MLVSMVIRAVYEPFISCSRPFYCTKKLSLIEKVLPIKVTPFPKSLFTPTNK